MKYVKSHWFYEWFIFSMWKGWRKLKSCVEMNVLCIVDQGNWVITLENTSKLWVKASKMKQYFRNCQINHKWQEKSRKYYCWKLRKRKVKSGIFFRNYSSRLARILSTIRADRARAVEEIYTYQEIDQQELDIYMEILMPYLNNLFEEVIFRSN